MANVIGAMQMSMCGIMNVKPMIYTIAANIIIDAPGRHTDRFHASMAHAQFSAIPVIKSMETHALRTIHIVPMIPNDAMAEFHKSARAMHGAVVQNVIRINIVTQAAANRVTRIIT